MLPLGGDFDGKFGHKLKLENLVVLRGMLLLNIELHRVACARVFAFSSARALGGKLRACVCVCMCTAISSVCAITH